MTYVFENARHVTTSLGLGTFEPVDAGPHSGRNDNITGTTSRGLHVFVKKLTGEDAALRMKRLVAFEETYRPLLAPSLRTPSCLGWDTDRNTIVFDWLRNAESGHTLVDRKAFNDVLAWRCGQAVGLLHGSTLGTALPVSNGPVTSRAPDLFSALPLSHYEQASGAQLDVWRILHRDGTVAASLRALRKASRPAPAVPIHGDLRLDQFLVDIDGPVLCDWEEFRAGDAACDIGAFIGEWLFRSLLTIPRTESDDLSEDAPPGDPHADAHRRIMERGLAAVAATQEKVLAFREGYAQSAGRIGGELAVRATAYAGWHLIERILAASESRAILGTLDRMLIGIGGTALRTPQKFAQTLGLEGEE
ncbi:class V lanthionine synthetase subunit LxmK [Streptomyces sp. NPDC001675]